MFENQEMLVDVHDWLTEPDDFSSSIGIVGLFYNAIFGLFSRLLQDMQNSASPSQPIIRRYKDELRRLYLWGDGFSVEEGQLDEVLVRTVEVAHNVLSILLQLSRVLVSDLHRISGLDGMMVRQDLTKDINEVKQMQEQVYLILQNSEIPQANPYPYSDSDSESQLSGLEEECVEDITTYIDCLMDLGQAIEYPAMDPFDGENGSSQQDVEIFDVTTSQALSYCRKIRDRFPYLPKYLVERLGESNVVRAIRISNAQETQRRIVDSMSLSSKFEEASENRTATNPITESLFSSTNPHLTETTKSTIQTSSSLSASLAPVEGLRSHLAPSFLEITDKNHRVSVRSFVPSELDDAASVVTFASYSTTASAISQGRPRMLPMPEVAGTWDKFDCPVCWRKLQGPMTRLTWKQHIFDDLIPYICIHQGCKETTQAFQRTKSWALHLQSHIETIDWSLVICPFCGPETKRLSREDFLRHVSSHLREVSMAVLPYSGEDDIEDESVDGDSVLSAIKSTHTHSSNLSGGQVEIPTVPDNNPDETPADGNDHEEQTAYDETEKTGSSAQIDPDTIRQAQRLLKRYDIPQDISTDSMEDPRTDKLTDGFLNIPTARPATRMGEIGDKVEGPFQHVTHGILPCELSLYSRCDFISTDKDEWKKHILNHFEGRSPWSGYWRCWFCDEIFDVVDSPARNNDPDFPIIEPPHLNSQRFYGRLDHIAYHLIHDKERLTNARTDSALSEWLRTRLGTAAKLWETWFCRLCGAMPGPPSVASIASTACFQCGDISNQIILNLYGFQGEIPEGSKCSTEPFGGPECEHTWQRAGAKLYCLDCKVIIIPNAWEHSWLRGREDIQCCYCGITSTMRRAAVAAAQDQQAQPAGSSLQIPTTQRQITSIITENETLITPSGNGILSRLGQRWRRRGGIHKK